MPTTFSKEKQNPSGPRSCPPPPHGPLSGPPPLAPQPAGEDTHTHTHEPRPHPAPARGPRTPQLPPAPAPPPAPGRTKPPSPALRSRARARQTAPHAAPRPPGAPCARLSGGAPSAAPTHRGRAGRASRGCVRAEAGAGRGTVALGVAAAAAAVRRTRSHRPPLLSAARLANHRRLRRLRRVPRQRRAPSPARPRRLSIFSAGGRAGSLPTAAPFPPRPRRPPRSGLRLTPSCRRAPGREQGGAARPPPQPRALRAPWTRVRAALRLRRGVSSPARRVPPRPPRFPGLGAAHAVPDTGPRPAFAPPGGARPGDKSPGAEFAGPVTPVPEGPRDQPSGETPRLSCRDPWRPRMCYGKLQRSTPSGPKNGRCRSCQEVMLERRKTSAWQNYENTGFLMRRPGFKASSAKHFLPALDTGHSLSPCASVLSSVKMEIVCGKCL
nr:basic proline-rich protein-like [Manis javanica]